MRSISVYVYNVGLFYEKNGDQLRFGKGGVN